MNAHVVELRELERQRIAVAREALRQAADVARSYEPRCDSCPRGVESAIANLDPDEIIQRALGPRRHA